MRRGFVLFVGTALTVIVLDQLVKWWVIQSLPLNIPVPAANTALGHFFSFTRVHNTGIAFSLFRGGGGVLVFLPLAVTAGLFVYERRLPPTERWLRVAIGLMAGGAIGNVIDRLRFGYVTDFLDFKFWPVFNVADSCVVLGVLMLAWSLWRTDQAQHNAESDTPPPASARPLEEPSE